MNNHFLKILIFVLLCSMPFCESLANQYIYTPITQQEWKIKQANTLFKDNRQFLWIGNNDGIYRFDGYDFKYYGNDKPSSYGYIVYKIFRDPTGNLFALTNEGIRLYDPDKDEFKSISMAPYGLQALFSFCPIEGGVLLGGRNKIFRYDYQTHQVTLCYDNLNTNEIAQIKNICYVGNHEFVFNELNTVKKLNINTRTITEVKCPSNVSSIVVDDENKIWVACMHSGLLCFDSKGRRLPIPQHCQEMMCKYPLLCMERQDSLLWVGTDGGGINILNCETFDVKRLIHIMGTSHTFPAKSVSSLFRDKNNTLWAASVRNGIISIRESAIKSYGEVPEKCTYGPSNPSILCFIQDNTSDDIWLGTDGDGLNRFNSTTHTFDHFDQTKEMKVVSIANYDSETLLMSIYLGHPLLLKKSTGKISPWLIKDSRLKALFRYSIRTVRLCEETSREILIFTDKIYRYNKNTQTVKELSFDYHQGHNNLIWAGRYGDSNYFFNQKIVFQLELEADSLQSVFRIPSQQSLNAVCIDQNGQIWLGTNKGLAYVKPGEKEMHAVATPIFDHISTLQTDNHGKVWIGEGDKTYCYNTGTRTFAIFDRSNGVIPNYYLPNARLLTRNGDICLGGTRGLLHIGHNFEMQQHDLPDVVLSAVKIDGEEVSLPSLMENREQTIHSGSKSVEIKVTTVEEDILRTKMFKYQIVGKNAQTLVTSEPCLSLHAFVPGEGKLFVSCLSKTGEWTQPQLLVNLKFEAPWYLRSWFFLLCFVLLVGTIFAIFFATLRRKENQHRMELKEKEKEIYAEKVKMLININHELRTPLTLINGPLKRIISTLPPSTPLYTTLCKIYHQSDRMKNLLNMVLDLRKMEVGKNELNIEHVDINPWLQHIVDDFNIEETYNAVKIIAELDPSCPQANLDKGKCEIVVYNLLSNAVKHSDPGSTVKVKSGLSDDGQLTIDVVDEGEGIQQEDTAQLFNRFYQGYDEQQGTGIGLSYSQMLVQLHKGTIGAYNNEEKGATFFIKLPQNLETGKFACAPRPYLNELFPRHDQHTEKVSTVLPRQHITENKTLLIVDDNAELIKFMKEAFEKDFKKIVVAPNGKVALQMVKEQLPDIVVSDIMMPLMDGYELCRQIKSDIEISHIPVVLLTARQEEQSRVEGYKMGADAYVAKPFEIETLYEILNSKLLIRENIRKRYTNYAVLPEPEMETFSQVDEQFLLKLNKIINENIDNPDLGIPFVCQEIAMSKASLYNKLKALTEMSCNEYINKIKMERAIVLIKSTDKNFTEISDAIGFANSRYFSTCFKQYTGMTPTQYRKDFMENDKES